MIKILRWLPALLWMMVIFYFSSLETTGVTGTHSIAFISIYWQRFLILKFFHLVEYATLFICLEFASGSWKQAFGLGYLYALSDEFHQRFTPGRTSKLTDTFIDLVGMSIGLIVYLVILKPQLQSRLKKVL